MDVRRVTVVAAAVLVMGSGVTLGAQVALQASGGTAPGRFVEASNGCPLRMRPGLSSLLGRVPYDQRTPASPAGAPADGPAWQMFTHAASAIVVSSAAGEAQVDLSLLRVLDGRERRLAVACTPALMARDRSAYKLALGGYTTPEIAAILRAERSRAQLDAARERRMAGLEPATLRPFPPASYASPGLDARGPMSMPAFPPPPTYTAASRPAFTRVSLLSHAVGQPPAEASPLLAASALDAQVRSVAAAYQVDYRLVTAMIQQESNWEPASISPKGAIGLMQLMPGTATMMGVDPRDPIDNIRGGVAYLAGLLRQYGDVRHALIAYNAGPEHANQVLRGERGVYPETRRYLDAIAAVYPF